MSVKDKAAAIDRFVRTIKESGVYDDIGTACIMAGWTNLAGALTPLKGTAPTNGGGLFQDADLDPGIGLKGDGSSYVDSNYACSLLTTDDNHASAYATVLNTPNTSRQYFGARNTGTGAFFDSFSAIGIDHGDRNFSTGNTTYNPADAVGLVGMSRDSTAGYDTFTSGVLTEQVKVTSHTASQLPEDLFVFARNNTGIADQLGDATLSWYSIGSATDLAALDSAVSTLMADLRSIDEAGFDPSALSYIRAVEAADGSFLETGVKQAINAFVVGCKKDGIWDALKASCILCGARTISGALVPLVGAAPTPYNFVSGNYNRSTGLVGVPASGTYIDTNRANNADGQDDNHNAVFCSQAATVLSGYLGSGAGAAGGNQIAPDPSLSIMNMRNRRSTGPGSTPNGYHAATGFMGHSRSESSTYNIRISSTDLSATLASETPVSDNLTAFKLGSFGLLSNARLAFYSIGSAIPDLALLDNRVSTLVSAIAAAI